jgi:hypothetical protein
LSRTLSGCGSESGRIVQAPEHQMRQPRNARRVAPADGIHLDDLPADELDPVVLIEDSRLAHPVVLVQREPPPD